MTTQTNALRLFTNQFLDHEGNPNGVHLGCDDLEVCKQSHVPGEISTVIHEWVDAAELRRIVAQRDALLEALKRYHSIIAANVVELDCDGAFEQSIAAINAVEE